MGPLDRRLRALERKVGDRAFTSGGPPVDEEGMPSWDGSDLSLESYERALGDLADEELTEAELAARNRLSPYAAVFEQLDEKARGGEDV